MQGSTRITETPRSMRLKPEAAQALGISVRQLERRLADGRYPYSLDSSGRVLVDIGSDTATAEAELVANYRQGSEVFATSTDALQVLAKRIMDNQESERLEHAATVDRLERRLEAETKRARRLGALAAAVAIVASSVVSWRWHEITTAPNEPRQPRHLADTMTNPLPDTASPMATTAPPSTETGSDTPRRQGSNTTDALASAPLVGSDAETVIETVAAGEIAATPKAP